MEKPGESHRVRVHGTVAGTIEGSQLGPRLKRRMLFALCPLPGVCCVPVVSWPGFIVVLLDCGLRQVWHRHKDPKVRVRQEKQQQHTSPGNRG